MRNILLAALALTACGSPAGPPADVVAFAEHVAPGLVSPGAEGLHCIDVPGPAVDTYINGWHATRKGAHHVNVWLLNGPHNPAPHTCPTSGKTFLFDTSEPDITTRFDVPGAAMLIPAGAWIDMDIHYFNPGEEPVPETVDLEFFAAPEHTVAVSAVSLDGAHAFSVPPHTAMVLGPYKWLPPSDMRLISLIGHQHAHGVWETLSVDGAEVYRSDNWAEPPHMETDIPLTPKSSVSWACDVNNTSSTALLYRNLVATGEMCVVNALAIGPTVLYTAP